MYIYIYSPRVQRPGAGDLTAGPRRPVEGKEVNTSKHNDNNDDINNDNNNNITKHVTTRHIQINQTFKHSSKHITTLSNT